MALGIVVPDGRRIKETKTTLEAHGLFDRRRGVVARPGGAGAIVATTAESLDSVPASLHDFDTVDLGTESTPADGPAVPAGRWAVYPPMVLYSAGSGLADIDQTVWPELLRRGAFGHRGLTHIAENAPIDEADPVRRPAALVPVYGDFGPAPTPESTAHPTPADFSTALWCTAVQNRICQTWAPRYTMFSRGNIVEKARLLSQDGVAGSTVVDLYAGIGYFVFSYALQRPRRIFCWELNAWSVEGLVRGAALNGWNARVVDAGEPYDPRPDDFIVVFHEDNCHAEDRLTHLGSDTTPISHINMGLLPDCRPAWAMAQRLATKDSSPTVVHVHENVEERALDAWRGQVGQAFGSSNVSLHKVKSFAPGILHVVADVAVGS